jgi:hypothetical protein
MAAVTSAQDERAAGYGMALTDTGVVVAGNVDGTAALVGFTTSVTDGGSTDPGGGNGGGVQGSVTSGPGVKIQRVVWPKSVPKLISKGVRVLASCEQDCKLSASVYLHKQVDGIARRTEIARGKGSTTAGQSRWLSATLTPSALRALRGHAGKIDLPLGVRVTATGR